MNDPKATEAKKEIARLNDELCKTYFQENKYPTKVILDKITKLRREIRKCVNRNQCVNCDKYVVSYPFSKGDHHYGYEYLTSGICPDCQPEFIGGLK